MKVEPETDEEAVDMLDAAMEHINYKFSAYEKSEIKSRLDQYAWLSLEY